MPKDIYTPADALHHFVNERAWNERSQTAILLAFIAYQHGKCGAKKLFDFLSEVAQEQMGDRRTA